ncbi:Sec7-domain-containing protein [Trichodelitschia bisporula]|uniref:Sec7-domain-containing protein n=1 Tax=Trichodelitschia bisporula TaxID=703511 RepID=A0A6G1HKX7_9PEZI|nr:Sec7-domain-containing protein [Trichodelitschia bisporula]
MTDSSILSELCPPPKLVDGMLAGRPSSISVAVDPVALVITECIAVTSAMRKHARWAHSSVSAILGGASNRPLPLDTQGRSRVVLQAQMQEEEGLGGRWGLRAKKSKVVQDNPLMSAFTKLRSDLRLCKDIRNFDTPALLHPFLQVIRSSSTSASITSLALIAVTKFLSYNVIGRDSPRLPQAMQLLSAAITHCRFEASSTAADEVVYVRILKLMEGMVSGPGGDILSDESVCQIMETGLGLCCESRFTQLLQRSAEIAMVSMCQIVFERLKHLEIEAGDEPGALDEDTKDDMDTVKMDPGVNGTTSEAFTGNQEGEQGTATQEKTDELTVEKPHEEPITSSLDLASAAVSGEPSIKPYSLPSIKELFRSLVELLDPHDGRFTDTMRVIALRIIDVALEVAGPSIASHPSLASLAKDTLCRHLFQLVRSENMAILNESLRVTGTLLATCRSVLKLQQELYLSYLVACLFPRIDIPAEPGINPKLYQGVPQGPTLIKPAPSQTSSGRSTPVPVKDRQKLGLEGGLRKPDAREAMIESIGALVRIPSFMAELFVNYDCEIDRTDLCTDMVGLLSRNAFPDAATWSTTNVPPLCLDALLGYVQSMADRLDDPPVTEGLPTVEHLRAQRGLKKVIITGAAKFNENPKAGISFLANQGVIKNIDDPKEIATFVRGTARLDKKVLGEFLSKGTNEKILGAFMESFDFRGLSVLEALRQLLYTFRLPGESQLIERIITEFSSKYFADGNHDKVADQDAVLVLSYAIVMLNTDQHSPNLKGQKRMVLEDFARNLRGVNGGKDFELEYLESVFTSIRNTEIVLPEEHNNKIAYEHAWQELLIKIKQTSDVTLCNTNIYDADIFAATWKPIVATLSYVFMSASEDAVFSRVFTGFDQCAQLAAKHGLSDALDQIVFCLSSISTLASEIPPSTSLNTEVQANDKSVMVSETAVRFGRDDRAQQATVVLFRVLEGNEGAIRDAWTSIIRILLNLFINSLIPPSLAAVSNHLDVPPIPLQPPAQVIERGERQNEGGLFSIVSSYVSSFASDEPPEPSELEIENTLCAVDCISQCGLDGFFARLGDLPISSLRPLLDSLLAQIPEDSSPTVIVVKPDIPAPSPRPNGHRNRTASPAYDPTLVFVLELATVLALRDEETIEQLGKDVVGALQAVLRNASSVHYVTISRVVYYLLILLRAGDQFSLLRAPLLLHNFTSFPPALLHQTALPLLTGISTCIAGPAGLRKEMATSPDFWDLLRQLRPAPDAAPRVFAILTDLVEPPGAPGVSADNYEQAVMLLEEFADAGAVGAIEEQRRDAIARRQHKDPRSRQTQVPRCEHDDEVKRAVKAVALVLALSSKVPSFISQSQLERREAWAAYWSPIFRVLAGQCLNPCREVRTMAFSGLRQALLSREVVDSSGEKGDTDGEGNEKEAEGEWTRIFGEVLFPLVWKLLKPEVYASDPVGMSETRVQAAQLLCRIFLHYLVALEEGGVLVEVWGRILGVMDRLVNSGQGDTLEEAVAENMKNILLVMSSGGYLAPPEQKPEYEELWAETWKRLNRFLPDLFAELFPEEAKKPIPAIAKGKIATPASPEVKQEPAVVEEEKVEA